MDGRTFALLIRRDGYWPVALEGEKAISLSTEIMAGEIGPSWLWPDPDGLFVADFDGDGVAEPFLTFRQGKTWRELRIYDLTEAGFRQVFRGRTRMPEIGYTPGFRFIRRNGEAIVIMGQGPEAGIMRWDPVTVSFQPVAGLAVAAEGDRNLLAREFLIGADWLPGLW